MNEDSIKLTKSIEDCLEVMYNLKKTKGTIRVTDIAEALNIKPPSVVEVVAKLSKLKLISHQKYGEIKLNKNGIKIAEGILYKHTVLKNFLDILGVDNEVSEGEACAMEHILSDSTVDKLKKFTQFIEVYSKHNDFLASFRNYENLSQRK